MAEKATGANRKPREGAGKAPVRPARSRGAAAKPGGRTGTILTGEPTPEERWRMVAEAAYYIAEKRDFVGGDPACDWYEAEKQVEFALQQPERPAKGNA